MPERSSGSARDLLNELLGSAFDFLSDRAAEVAPRCCFCDEVALPLRCTCGHFACKDHGFFNIIEMRVICPCCAAKLGAPPPQYAPPGARQWTAAGRRRKQAAPQRKTRRQQEPTVDPAIAWELLGLDPATATEESVKKVYRQLAFECHPDRNNNDPTAARRFRGLQAAKDACVADLKARER